MKTRPSFAALAAPALLAPLLAHAQLTDEDMCRNGAFPSQPEFRTATVGKNAQPRLYFMKDDEGCPQKGGDQCRAGGYVVPGDELLLGKTHGKWTCAWFNGKKHETVGWVDNTALAEQPQPTEADWAGKWTFYNVPGYLGIVRKGGGYYIHARMIHPTPASENLGSMKGNLKVEGSRAIYSEGPQEYQCTANLVRAGRFLIVRDNEACGGVGVRFNGVYTRAR
jgi:hypothetical protein